MPMQNQMQQQIPTQSQTTAQSISSSGSSIPLPETDRQPQNSTQQPGGFLHTPAVDQKSDIDSGNLGQESASAAEAAQREKEMRQDIRDLQAFLRTLSFEYPEIPPVAINGFYNEQTVDAVKAFQRVMGLPETGLLDYETNYLLNRTYYDLQKRNSPPTPIQPFPNNDHVVQPEEKSFLVAEIQLFLALLQQYFANFQEQPLNGIFDEPTQQNIRELQKVSLLPITGLVDKATWNALALLYNNVLYSHFLQEA